MASKRYCRIVYEVVNEEKGRENYYLQYNMGNEWKTSILTEAINERISDSILWDLNHMVHDLGFQFTGIVSAGSLEDFESWEVK